MKVKDLSDQKVLMKKELNEYMTLHKNAQEQLIYLGKMQSTKDYQSTNVEGDKLSSEFSMYKKYEYTKKFRRSVIAVLAANRLLKYLKKDSRYGKKLENDVMYKGTSEVNFLLPYIGIINTEKLPNGALTKIISNVIQTSTKLGDYSSELSMILQSLEEIYKNDSIKYKKIVQEKGDLLYFLREGLMKFKGKYSWLHLGVPLDYLSENDLNNDRLINRNYILQENAKKIERNLIRLKEIPQLQEQLNLSKDKENALIRELASIEKQVKEYEENIHQLMAEIDNLREKETIMVSATTYDDVVRDLEHKGKEVISLTNTMVIIIYI